MKTIFSNAKLVARLTHGTQQYSDRSYLYHLQMVVDILIFYGFGPGTLAAGWLHDTIEDTSVTREEIEQAFGAEIGAIVWACTGIGENRKERNASIYAKLRELPPAQPVKLADRMANLHCSLIEGRVNFQEMYIREHPDFRAALTHSAWMATMVLDYEAMIAGERPLIWVPQHEEYELKGKANDAENPEKS